MRANTPHAETPLSSYRRSLAPWITLPQQARQGVVASLELLVLQGRDEPLDGRAVIVENQAQTSQQWPQGHQPAARYSRPGDVIRLVSPQEIAAFAAYRRTLDLVIGDLETGPSEQERAYEAIAEAIRLADRADHRTVVTKVERFLADRAASHPIVTVIVVGILFFSACLALGGGIFSAAPGNSATAANGGLYLINRYTGEVSFCLPGGCR
jgi:hypothetical protein